MSVFIALLLLRGAPNGLIEGKLRRAATGRHWNTYA
jgi:hypothetical protein